MSRNHSLFIALIIGLACSGSVIARDIVHDGEYKFLRAQYGAQWDAEDAEISQKLAEIRARNGGKTPNVLYILIDDVSFGQMGNRALNYVTGIRTPSINEFAAEGASLMRMYTEPSCTPTRAAFLTGRHPVRMGLKETKGALVGEGLPSSEVTIAEVLSKAGYNTAHIGKWHQGDIEEAFPHNQGFDYAAFPVHQQVQLSLMHREAADAGNMIGWYRGSQSNRYELDKKFRPSGLVTGLEARRGEKAREVDLKPGEEWTKAHYVRMNERYQRQAVEQLRSLAQRDKPFFLQYWPLYPLNFDYTDVEQAQSENGGFHADKLQELDGMLGELLDTVDQSGIADNTLVVLMADNGLFLQYAGESGLTDLVYRGGKAQHLEGGVRVDAFVRWPGVIEAGSAVGDIVHVSDLFTTIARIADATDAIPTDRVIDGIDQTALLLKGDTHGRRDYVYIYENDVLRSVVKQEFKMHLPPPGVPGAIAPVFNLLRDPREEYPKTGTALWSGASFQDMVKRHQKTIAKYPHAKLGKGRPYTGIENLRPESVQIVELFASWQ
jgi:arylsulfatase